MVNPEPADQPDDGQTSRTPRRPCKPALPDLKALPDLHGIADLPPDEAHALAKRWLRENGKAKRRDRLSRGYGTPRTRAEIAIWEKGIDERFGLPERTEPDQPA